MSKILIALFALAAFMGMPKPAEAITAELAKKCRAMAVQAHPTQRPGTKTGSQKAQNEYYRECVAKDGKMDDKPKTNN